MNRPSSTPNPGSGRRDFLRQVSAATVASVLLGGRADASSAASPRVLHLPLTDPTSLDLQGPHRFITIGGLTGFQPTSLRTKAMVSTTLHRSPAGAVSLWFSPLEDAGFYPVPLAIRTAVPTAAILPLISDADPAGAVETMRFGLFWTAGYPQLLGKFAAGGIWTQLNFGLAPFVYAERLILRAGAWYHLLVTWDKPRRSLRLYVNGRLMGRSDSADNFAEPGETLRVGNTAMIVRDLRIETSVPTETDIRARYAAQRPAGNGPADEDIHQAVDLITRPPLDLVRDSSWAEAYATDFTRQRDVEAWPFQTGDKHRSEFTIQATAEGLLARTPDLIANDSRMYLWSPFSFEGDQWVEYDFRPESTDGLSLLTVCCRGPLREDFLLDHAMEKSGSMGVILNQTYNYHWEYVRRVEVMRRDVETQYLTKNPWGRRLSYGCIPRLDAQWHRLRFVKVGRRMHGSIDGRTVFDVTDDPLANNGPVLNFGRLGLRQMYKTTMRYRNLSVHTRPLA